MHSKKKTMRMMTLSALLAAMTCVMTMFVKIPIPVGGYVHLGDAFVLLCGWLLGPIYGACSAGIGSMLADLFSGYPQYAIFTLIIKALMAMTVYACGQTLCKKQQDLSFFGKITGGILAELIMALGYFACDWMFYGSAAFVNLALYLLKGGGNLAVAMALMTVMERTGLRKRI